MNDRVDCLVFGDQLDALVTGTLPAPAVDHLRAHAAVCAECEALFRVHEHLAQPSLAELEARVPGGLLEELPDRVMDAIRTEAAPAGQGGRVGPGPGRGSGVVGRIGLRLVPWLAAASLALLASTAFLAREVGQLRGREQVLAMELEARRAQVQGLQASLDPARPAAASRRPGTRPGLFPLRETVTVEVLVEFLGGLPPARVVLSEAEVQALLRRPGELGGPALRSLVARLPLEGGITAGDLVAALTGPGIRPEVEIDAGRLMNLVS